MTPRWPAAAGAVLIPAIVAAALLWPAAPPSEAAYSFEEGMEGWAPNATDLSWGNCTAGASSLEPPGMSQGNCTVTWAIERTTELSRDGTSSVRLYLENLNDAGKIWMEKVFTVSPNRTYRVHIAFAFASADFGSMNHWRIIAGALPARPASADDLTPLYRGDTGNGLESSGGYVWLEKGYDSTVNVGADGRLWTVLGVWGTWETPRTYYVDAVRVSIL